MAYASRIQLGLLFFSNTVRFSKARNTPPESLGERLGCDPPPDLCHSIFQSIVLGLKFKGVEM